MEHFLAERDVCHSRQSRPFRDPHRLSSSSSSMFLPSLLRFLLSANRIELNSAISFPCRYRSGLRSRRIHFLPLSLRCASFLRPTREGRKRAGDSEIRRKRDSRKKEGGDKKSGLLYSQPPLRRLFRGCGLLSNCEPATTLCAPSRWGLRLHLNRSAFSFFSHPEASLRFTSLGSR